MPRQKISPADRKAELIRKRDEYNADREVRKNRYEEREQAYHRAMYDVTSVVKEYLETHLAQFDLLHFDVSVQFAWGGVEARIQCDEWQKHEEISALSWDYRVTLDEDGTIKRETNSWSGMKATTREQLDNLKQTLAALEFLLSINWGDLLDIQAPKYSDYVTEQDPRYADKDVPDYDAEITQIELDELVGTKTLIKAKYNVTDKNRRYGSSTYYYVLTKSGAKTYTVEALSEYWVNNKSKEGLLATVEDYLRWGSGSRIDKTAVAKAVVYPLETINLEETVETSTDIMSSEEYEYGGYRIVDNNGTWSIEDEEGTIIAEGFSSDDEARDYIDEE